MKKKQLVLFIFLFVFWIVISGTINLQHIVVGVLLSLFTVWFWRGSSSQLPPIFSPRELLLFLRCIVMLLGHVIISNINIIKLLLFSNIEGESIFLELEPDLESDWGRVFLAVCITITPGTIAVDLDPENNIFTIHALTVDIGVELYYWRIISEIRYLETLIKRRKTDVVNNDRIHDSDITSANKSNHRSERD